MAARACCALRISAPHPSDVAGTGPALKMSAANDRSETPRFGVRIRNNQAHLAGRKLAIIFCFLVVAMRIAGQYGMVD